MTEKLPELQQHEKLNPTLLPQGIGQALNQFAASDTILGDIGTTVMQTAAQQRAMQKGYELGETPQGTLSPSITDFDKTVNDAYKSRSQAVLGNQADALINKGEEALHQAGYSDKTKELYLTNTAKGLENIFDNAPDGVRENLIEQYTKRMNDSTHQINLKLISQTKEEDSQNYISYSKTSIEGIQTSAIQGKYDVASKGLKTFNEYNQQSLDSHTITKETFEKNRDAMRIAAESGASINEATKALQDNNLTAYMAQFSDDKRKPDNMSLSDWKAVGTNTAVWMDNLQKYKQAQDAQVDADVMLLSQANQLDNGQLLELTKDMSRTARAKTIFKARNQIIKNNKSIEVTSSILANKDNAVALAAYTPEQISKAWVKDVQNNLDASAKTKHPMSQQEAEIQSALSFGRQVKLFVDRTNAAIDTGAPRQLADALVLKGIAVSQRKLHLLGLTDRNANKLNFFQTSHSTGNQDDVSAQNAELAVSQDKQVMEFRQQRWNDELKANWNTTKKKLEQTRALFGLSNWAGWFATPLANQNALAILAQNTQELNHKINDDTASATKTTTERLQSIASETNVNGLDEVGIFNLSDWTGFPEDANSSYWKVIQRHMEPSFTQSKQLYDKGKFPFYYKWQHNVSEGPPRIIQQYRNKTIRIFTPRMDAVTTTLSDHQRAYNITLRAGDGPESVVFEGLPNTKNGQFLWIAKIKEITKEYEKFGRQRNKDAETTPFVQFGQKFPELSSNKEHRVVRFFPKFGIKP